MNVNVDYEQDDGTNCPNVFFIYFFHKKAPSLLSAEKAPG